VTPEAIYIDEIVEVPLFVTQEGSSTESVAESAVRLLSFETVFRREMAYRVTDDTRRDTYR